MKKSLFFALLPGILFSSLSAESVKVVIDKSIDAVGGKDAMLAITSRRSEFKMLMPAMNMTADVTMVQKAPDKMFMKTVMPVPGMEGPGMETVMGFNGKDGWMTSNVMGSRMLSSQEIQSNQLQSDFYLLLDWKDRFPDSEYLGTQDYHGKRVHAIRANSEGNPITFYFDAESFLMSGMKTKTVMQEGEIDADIQVQNYVRIDNVMVPQRVVIRNPVSEIIMEAAMIQHNKPVEDSLFAVPEELR